MSLTFEEVTAKLQLVFDSVFDEPVKVRPDLTAGEVEEWDSLTHVTLIVAVEKDFGIKFRASEINGFQNVKDLIDRIIELSA
jgi:acyl carrier protein